MPSTREAETVRVRELKTSLGYRPHLRQTNIRIPGNCAILGCGLGTESDEKGEVTAVDGESRKGAV